MRGVEGPSGGGTGRGLPRALEIAFAIVGLLLVSPVLLVCALAVVCTSTGGVLFRQDRVGQGGTPFTLLKLRTMRAGAAGPMVTAAGDSRVTFVGRLLRRTKLDELPELWNVIRGDMALVGPRPEVPHYVDLADPEWRAVLAVRPGIVDPVTLVLRNEEELMASAGGDREEFYRTALLPFKLRGYREYLDRRTPLSDLSVLARTVLVVAFPSRAPVLSADDVRGVSSGSRGSR